jgi:hypothetical protein
LEKIESEIGHYRTKGFDRTLKISHRKPASLQGERLESERRVAEQQRIEAERNKPANVLLQSYSQYIYLKKCELERHGYLSVNLSELELDRAKTAVRNIEKKMTETDPALDKDSLWQTANTAKNSVAETDRDRCQLPFAYRRARDAMRCGLDLLRLVRNTAG